MSSAYKRRDAKFRAKMLAIAEQRDKDYAYYEALIGQPLANSAPHGAARTYRTEKQISASIQWWLVTIVVLGLLGWAIVGAR